MTGQSKIPRFSRMWSRIRTLFFRKKCKFSCNDYFLGTITFYVFGMFLDEIYFQIKINEEFKILICKCMTMICKCMTIVFKMFHTLYNLSSGIFILIWNVQSSFCSIISYGFNLTMRNGTDVERKITHNFLYLISIDNIFI